MAIAMALAISTAQIDEYRGFIAEVCSEYEQIDPELIEAMVEAESSWNAEAVSRAGAIGLMQIIPKWQGERMEKLGVSDLSDPLSNIKVGVDYLNELMDMAEDPAEALMIYNAGWAGKELYHRGYISKYAHGILIRSFEIKEERKADERNNLKTACNLEL